MSTYLTYEKCYSLVQSNFPQLTTDEERRAKLNEVVTEALAPQLSQAQFFRMLERNAITDPPHHMTQFSTAERAQRKARSQAVRNAVFDWMFENQRRGAALKPGLNLPRQYQQLLEPVDPAAGNDLSPHNKEIIGLFSLNEDVRKDYEEEAMLQHQERGLDARDARKTAQLKMSRRRIEIVMDYMNKYYPLLDHLDEMTKPDLSPEQLAKNYRQISEASEAFSELDAIIADANSGRLHLNEEQMEQLQQMRLSQDHFANAREKLNVISNPMYESVDVDQLRYYDLTDFEKEYEAALDEDRPHPELTDNFLNVVHDYQTSKIASRNNISDAYNQVLEDYNFDRKAVSLSSETPRGLTPIVGNEDDLVNGKPVAVSQGNKVVILSRVSPDSDEITAMHTGRLFDQFHASKTRLLTANLEKADPLFLHSSKQFKAMKASLRQVSQMPPLGDFPSGKDIIEARKALTKLLRTSEEYRATKAVIGKNDREQARIDVANQIKAYAKMKLDQLTIIEKAELTYEKYKNMLPEDIKALDAKEAPEAEAFRIDLDEREKNREAMARHDESKPAPKKEEPAPEQKESAPKKEEPASEKKEPAPKKEEPASEKKESAPKKEEPAPEQPQQDGASFIQQVTHQYRDTIKPLRGDQLDESEKAFLAFTDKQLLNQARQYDKSISDAKGDLSAEMDSGAKLAGTLLIRDCIIHSLVQMEREGLGKNGPGNLEQMIQDPAKLAKIQRVVETSPDFQHMMATKFFAMGDSPALDTVPKMLAAKEPQMMAKSVLSAVKKAQQAAQNAPAKAKAQPQRQQEQPQKKPMQPQK